VTTQKELITAGADFLVTRYVARVAGKRQVVATVDAHRNINLTDAGERLLGRVPVAGESGTATKAATARKSAPRKAARVENPVALDTTGTLFADE